MENSGRQYFESQLVKVSNIKLNINSPFFNNLDELQKVIIDNNSATKFKENFYTCKLYDTYDFLINNNELYIYDTKFNIKLGNVFTITETSFNIKLINNPILRNISNIQKLPNSNVSLTKNKLKSLETLKTGISIIYNKKKYTIEEFIFISDALYIETSDKTKLMYNKDKITIAKELTNANKLFKIGTY